MNLIGETKQEILEFIDLQISNFQKSIDELNDKKNVLENSKEVFLNDLIEDFLKEHSQILTKNTENQSYKHILGGDGRSMPYDEQRMGLCLNINLDEKYFLNKKDLSKFLKFIQLVKPENVVAVFFNKNQINFIYL